MRGAAVASRMSPATPLPPIPRTTTFSISSRVGSPSMPRATLAAAATCSGRRAVTPNMSSVSRARVTRRRSTCPLSRRRLLPGGLDALGLGLGQEATVLVVAHRLGLVDEHDGDVVLDGVPALQARVVEGLLVLEVDQRALVLGAGEDLEHLRVEGQGSRHAPFLIRSTTSLVRTSQSARDAASTLRRRSGSVLDGRRLNHQSPRSTVRPSSRSWAAEENAAATRSMTAVGSATSVLISPESA